MFVTLLDYAESSVSSINEYVIGEVPHDFDTDVPIEIIGFDCESCEKKVRVILWGQDWTFLDSYWLVQKTISFKYTTNTAAAQLQDVLLQ